MDGCRRHGIGKSTKETFLVIKGGRLDPIPVLLTQLLLQEGDKASSGPLRETIPTLRELVVSSIDKSKEESPSPLALSSYGQTVCAQASKDAQRHCKQAYFVKVVWQTTVG